MQLVTHAIELRKPMRQLRKIRMQLGMYFSQQVRIFAGIGLWRHYYLKIMNAEPVKIFNSKSVKPSNFTTDANTPKATPIKVDDNTVVTDVESSKVTPSVANSNTTEEMVNTSNSSTDTIFGDLIEQNLPPEAAAALEKYKKAQSEHAAISRKLVSLLKADPLDWDAINLMDSERT